MKSLGTGKVVHALNPGRLRQDLLSLRSPWDKQVPDPGVVTHTFNLDTPSAGGLHKDIGRRKILSSLPACTYLLAHLLEPTSLVGYN